MTGELLQIGSAERAATIEHWPALTLVRALSLDGPFIEVVKEARRDEAVIDVAARRYVRRDGRTRRVISHVIHVAVDSELDDPQQAVCSAATFAVWTSGAEAAAGREWTHSRTLAPAAAMVARLGSRRCLVCGHPLATDGVRRRYCSAHGDTRSRKRADQEAMRRLLLGAADALDVD